MKTVILHVGPHKTGSTYIQKILVGNRSGLKQHRITYPNIYFFALGQHRIVDVLKTTDDLLTVRNSIEKEFSDFDYCIFSSENFANLGISGLERCKEIFRGYEVIVIYFIRRPSERIRSIWQEQVKYGSHQTLDSFLVDKLKNPFIKPIINPAPFLTNIIKSLQPARLAIVDYDSAADENALMRYFWKACALENIAGDVEDRVNSMMPVEEIEFLRAMNFFASAEGCLDGTNVRDFFFQRKEQFMEYLTCFAAEVSKYKKDFVIGNWQIDSLVKNMMERDWAVHFVNEISLPCKKIVQTIDSTWQLDKKAISIVRDAYDFNRPALQIS